MSAPKAPRVVLVSEPTGGGVGRHVLDLAEQLPARGFEVLLLYSMRHPDARFVERVARHEEFGYLAATFPVGHAPALDDVFAWRALRRAMATFGAVDVLHAHSSKAGALARLARWRRARHVVYSPHAFYTQSRSLGAAARASYTAIEWGLAHLADRVVVLSQQEWEHARSLGIATKKLARIENGIPTRDEASTAAARRTSRATLGIGADEVVVGFLGRLTAQKAPRRAVEVFELVHRASPSLRLVLVGDGPDAAMVDEELRRRSLASAVARVPAGGPDLMAAFDIFLLTSEYEGFPYVFLEALDSGCAIVTTAVGGAHECVVEGENGAIVAPASAEQLAAAVVSLAADQDRLYVMRGQSRAIGAFYSLDRMVDRLADLYRSLISVG